MSEIDESGISCPICGAPIKKKELAKAIEGEWESKQIELIIALADPLLLNEDKISKNIGISKAIIDQWKNLNGFWKDVENVWNTMLLGLDTRVSWVLIKKALEGNPQAIKLCWKLIERIPELRRQLPILPKQESIMGYVYLIHRKGTDDYKIGMTNGLIEERIKRIQERFIFEELELINYVECESPREIEKQLHNKFSNKRIRGEWFAFSSDDLEYLSKFFDDMINFKNGKIRGGVWTKKGYVSDAMIVTK